MSGNLTGNLTARRRYGSGDYDSGSYGSSYDGSGSSGSSYHGSGSSGSSYHGSRSSGSFDSFTILALPLLVFVISICLAFAIRACIWCWIAQRFNEKRDALKQRLASGQTNGVMSLENDMYLGNSPVPPPPYGAPIGYSGVAPAAPYGAPLMYGAPPMQYSGYPPQAYPQQAQTHGYPPQQ